MKQGKLSQYETKHATNDRVKVTARRNYIQENTAEMFYSKHE